MRILNDKMTHFIRIEWNLIKLNYSPNIKIHVFSAIYFMCVNTIDPDKSQSQRNDIIVNVIIIVQEVHFELSSFNI